MLRLTNRLVCLLVLVLATNAYAQESGDVLMEDEAGTPKAVTAQEGLKMREKGSSWTWFGMGYESRRAAREHVFRSKTGGAAANLRQQSEGRQMHQQSNGRGKGRDR
ncbi:MAG: hypothetical protein JMN27_05250 [gamma proteobacterium endosymbiont of Lamellibrachia anaximandri]|nr:hypothetical protein [gamma proteobacterium endosymbiont of Lamellibrachia anaximandri]MBL3533223.1 hypothetical protein [gamma proteobacterium endosymbiont of Lamellibrachia anaximandri]